MVPAPLFTESLSLDQPLVILLSSGQNAFLHSFSPKDRTQHNLLLYLHLLPLFFFNFNREQFCFFFERNVLYVNENLMNKQVSVCHKAFTVLIQNTNQFLHFWV